LLWKLEGKIVDEDVMNRRLEITRIQNDCEMNIDKFKAKVQSLVVK